MNSSLNKNDAIKVHVIGCDIGGANLKLADTNGRSAACSFPMWLKSAELAASLRGLLSEFPVTPETQFAVTMTGELADCFATRREGVELILQQTLQAFAPERTHVYAVGNQWMTPHEAIASPWSVAASNWYALATWIGAHFPFAPDLVLDIGSTTVDIIPMQPSTQQASSQQPAIYQPATSARTDRDRLELGQLVYTGIERTPIAAILQSVQLHNKLCPLMAERFATSDDCYVLLGLTPESPDDCDTADGRSRTQAHAHGRLARMIGEDSETLPISDARAIAQQCIDAQATQIARAIDRNLNRNHNRNLNADTARIVVAGHGRSLAEVVFAKLEHQHPNRQFNLTWLDETLSPSLARSAPAAAVAHLLAKIISQEAAV